MAYYTKFSCGIWVTLVCTAGDVPMPRLELLNWEKVPKRRFGRSNAVEMSNTPFRPLRRI